MDKVILEFTLNGRKKLTIGEQTSMAILLPLQIKIVLRGLNH